MRQLLLLFALAQPATAGGMTEAKDAFDGCVSARLQRLVKSCEPAETVATAVLAGCDSEERKLTVAMDLPMSDAETAIRSIISDTRDGVIAALVEHRLETPCN